MSDDTERREFLKIAGAALGGLTLTALGTTEAQADSTMMAGPAMMRPGKLRTLALSCGPDIDIDHLVLALKKGLGQAGCMRCGLLGIDVILHQGDPVERQGTPIKIDVPGVKATFG